MSIEAMRLALEALEWCYDVTEWPANGESPQDKAITALRAAIEQAEESNAQREVEIEFTQWLHPHMGVVSVDPKTPLILKAKLKEKNA